MPTLHSHAYTKLTAVHKETSSHCLGPTNMHSTDSHGTHCSFLQVSSFHSLAFVFSDLSLDFGKSSVVLSSLALEHGRRVESGELSGGDSGLEHVVELFQ